MSEFPEELIERCAESVRETEDGRIPRRIVEAVLRESGYAELVAALEAFIKGGRDRHGYHFHEDYEQARLALRKAAAL